MGVFVDLTGRKFNRLKVLGFSHRNKQRNSMWICKCECGSKIIARGSDLLNGHSTSCGCIKKSLLSKLRKKHGLTGTRIYEIWKHLIRRSTKEQDRRYKDYGARGITVCNEWKRSFIAFYEWAVDNGYRENLTIDRIDNNKGYNPSNCRWATPVQQARNKRNNHYITLNGETHCISEWAEKLGISQYTISRRLRSGWSEERSLKEPLRGTKSCG